MSKKEQEEEDFEKDVKLSGSFISKKALEYFGKKTLLPPTSLLSKDSGRPEVGDIKSQFKIL